MGPLWGFCSCFVLKYSVVLEDLLGILKLFLLLLDCGSFGVFNRFSRALNGFLCIVVDYSKMYIVLWELNIEGIHLTFLREFLRILKLCEGLYIT